MKTERQMTIKLGVNNSHILQPLKKSLKQGIYFILFLFTKQGLPGGLAPVNLYAISEEKWLQFLKHNSTGPG